MNKNLIKNGAIALGCLIVVLSLLYAYRINTRNAVEVLAQNKKLINVLVMGSNVFHDNKHRFFAVLSVNPENNRTGITLLPPSLKIPLDRGGKKSVKLDEIDIDSFSKISRTLEAELKINVPFWVEIYATDVERLVDTLEGVDIFVLDQVRKIDGVRPGLNYFDGAKAVQYINSVEGGSVYRTYDRIQDILLSLYYNRERYRPLVSLKFISHLLTKIRTNMLDKELFSLSRIIFDEGDLQCIRAPGKLEDDGFYVIDDVATKIYEKEFLSSLVLGAAPDATIRVKVLNGTNIPGLAKKMRNALNREGVNVIEFGTSPYPFMDHTVIINQSGSTGDVRKIAELAGVTRVHHIVDSSQLSDALIIIGKDYAK
ncbi:MAG: LytR family transcriptional regulator [Spirochaetes bacterium]|nr:MAG: LytR family transcriptional regulator [Spirochaetota bacterium]